MHLEFTPEQLELRESARSVLARECPPALVGAAARGERDGAQLTRTLAWLGWPALTVPVDLGGLGRSTVDQAVVLEEAGRAAAPGPLLATTMQFVPAVREAGSGAQVHRFLSSVAAGDTTGTVALYDDPISTGPAGATAHADGDGWVLRGRKRHVLCAPQVDEIVVPARCDDGTLALFVVSASDLVLRGRSSTDPTRPVADVNLDDVWVPATRRLGRPGQDAAGPLARVIAHAAAGAALDAIGACAGLVDAAAGAAITGRVAPRPLEDALVAAGGPPSANAGNGSGPAPDPEANGAHHPPPPQLGGRVLPGAPATLGGMLVALEAARALTYQAVAALAEGHATSVVTANAALVATARAVRTVTTGALQLVAHADDASTPIDVELWSRRAWASTLLLGPATDQRSRAVDDLFGTVPAPAAARPQPAAIAAPPVLARYAGPTGAEMTVRRVVKREAGRARARRRPAAAPRPTRPG